MPEKNAMEKYNELGNIEISQEKGLALFSLNPKIYGLDAIYSAAMAFQEKASIILDGDPAEEILVELRLKNIKDDINTAVEEFNSALIKASKK